MKDNNQNIPSKGLFDNISPLSESSFSELKNILQLESLRKEEVFITEGNRNNWEYLIIDGFCRSFLMDPEGEEITLSFFKPKSVISPHITRTREQVSLLNFQALTEVNIIKFDAVAFLNLMIANLEIRNLGNTILLNELLQKTEKEIALASLTAKERLMKFRSEYGILENLIAHPIIASYLGITNVSLSRLRSESAKQ